MAATHKASTTRAVIKPMMSSFMLFEFGSLYEFRIENYLLYSISFETYTFILTIWSPQFFAGCPQMIADSYAKSVVFI